jgi:quinol monooxygenase YgiN
LVAILLEAAEALNTLEECELYVVSVKQKVTDAIWVSEVWRNAEAHQASLSLNAVKVLIQKGRPLILDMSVIETFSPQGGKGLL